MTRDDPPNPPPQSLPDPSPVLNYLSPDPFAGIHRPPRKPLPTPFCVGFGAASIGILFVWAPLSAYSVHHSVLYIVLVTGMIGGTFAANKPYRLAGLAVLLALGIWFLMIGGCYAIGGFDSRVF